MMARRPHRQKMHHLLLRPQSSQLRRFQPLRPIAAASHEATLAAVSGSSIPPPIRQNLLSASMYEGS
uniref:Uncharacterized protein n=1 Tax=uncultured organism TaxID=155900 RepID=Q1ZZJ4_9ZZZZ|nr:unknown [uncultured organism]